MWCAGVQTIRFIVRKGEKLLNIDVNFKHRYIQTEFYSSFPVIHKIGKVGI